MNYIYINKVRNLRNNSYILTINRKKTMKKNITRLALACLFAMTAMGMSAATEEKQLYYSDFSDWCDYDQSATTSESTVTWTTKYSKEELTFTLYDVQVGCENWNTGKFPDWEGGFLMCAKSSDPYIITSALNSITTVTFMHGATGSNRGYALYAKGDDDDDWVLLSDAVASTATGTEVTVDVDRENCQLKFTNLNSSQNAYLMYIYIFGNVEMGETPQLGSFSVNGTEYEAGDIFEEADDGSMTATVQISKTETMISEDNPLTDVTADNGEVGDISYEMDGDDAIVTIPVTYDETTINYILTVEYKPDYTLTYYDTDGETVLTTQEVEQDATIGTLADYTGDVADGQIFRGWYVGGEGTRKYTTEEVITEDISLYAVVNDIEVESATERYSFDLTNQYFYDEDHEAFNSTGTGKYYNTHGWVFSSGDQIELLVGGHAYIIIGLCRYGNSGTITLTGTDGEEVGSVSTPASTDGTPACIEYSGDAGTVTLTLSNGGYVHSVAIVNDADYTITTNDAGYFEVAAGDADNLLAVLDVANAVASEDSRTYIYIPDGTYDLGDAVLTTISGDNISLIGQSMDGTIIKNTPTEEGISITATFYITASGTYFQDLTIQDALDYYDSSSAGRAVCIQDKGDQTICKNVKMLSYQDTYYTNNNSGQFYWEDSEIHGCVDYICGGGDAYFNRCLLYNESRASGSKYGSATMTAPYTSGSDWGYVFESCTIENAAASFNYGRAWGGTPCLAFLNTTLNQDDEIASTRFTLAGMNVAAYKFVEYNTLDTDGNVVSPSSNELTFTHSSGNNTMETILTDEEAAEYTLDNIFSDWAPDELCEQVSLSTVTLSGETLSWTAADDALVYAIFADDVLEAMTTETSYSIADTNATYTVRAANSMGGLGEAVTAEVSTGISEMVQTADEESSSLYNIQGQKVSESYKGVAVKVTKLSDGSVKSVKTIK